ncbi:MAG: ATP-binding protein [Bacteroidales bacterium]|nr:ATP-binding protein [Bacteroidales bacterium]
MIYKRKAYDKLLNWKEKAKGGKALLIEGARRIGKSTLVKAFGEQEYDSYIVIDFNDASPTVFNCFEEHLGDLDTFFMILSAEYGVRLHKRKSLIIFDEVQRYPRARQSVKRLVQDGRYDYIETGSLISLREAVSDITIPSEERRIRMNPMDFEEFAWACGEEALITLIRHCFEKKEPLESSLHRRAMMLFKQYMLVGGMPQSVDAFLSENKSFIDADVEKRDILSLYRSDIMKIGSRYRSRVISIFDQIPAFLSQHEKRVVFSKVGEGSYFSQYADTFFWLSDSMIANECFNCSDPNIGLSLNEERTMIKCYMGDTGLLVSHAFDETELEDSSLYRQILNDKLSINEGMLYENVIAQQLVANGYRLFFYNHYNEMLHRNDMEVDFLLSNQSKTNFKISPVEVKSSGNYRTTSLERFISKFRERIATPYIIHPRPLQIRDSIVAIPPYMAICL